MMEKKLIKICMEIYQDLYELASPSSNFMKLFHSNKIEKQGWFMNYYLDIDTQDSVIETHMKRRRLNKFEKSVVVASIHLGAAPNSSLKSWKKYVRFNPFLKRKFYK